MRTVWLQDGEKPSDLGEQSELSRNAACHLADNLLKANLQKTVMDPNFPNRIWNLEVNLIKTHST